MPIHNLIRTLFIAFITLATFATLARADELPPPSAYRRQIVHDGGLTYYIVGPRAPHLFMISRDVYGDERRWQDIATWNGIKAPYTLTVGQRLALKTDTTLTDAQANRQLVVAYSNLQRYETVERIVLSEKIEKSEKTEVIDEAAAAVTTAPVVVAPIVVPTPTPMPIPVATPVPTPAASPTPVPVVILAVPVIVATPTPLPSAPTPQATPEEKGTLIEESALPAHEDEAKGEHEARWHFSVAPLVSVAKLHSEFSQSGIKNNLNTDIDYGVEADIAFHYNEQDEVYFGAGIEHMDIKRPSSGAEIEAESQNLAHFELGIHHQVNHVSALKIAVIADEEAFSKPNEESAAIVPIYIPQILVGGDWWLVHHPKFGLNLNIDALVSLPTKKDIFDFDLGYGALVGFNFENEFKAGKLIYGLSGRYLNQNATGIKTSQEMALFKIGWEF